VSRRFFQALYNQLDLTFEHLISLNDADENVLAGLGVTMESCLNILTNLFNDRMTFGLKIHENTRPGLYATGAYESLLGKYSIWIQKLTQILSGLEIRDRGNLEFILAPVERDTIFSEHLDPNLNPGNEQFIMYHAPFRDMLEFEYALPVLVHEVGHYWGIFCRNDRAETFLTMVSEYFAIRIEDNLYNNYKITESQDKVSEATSKFAEEVRNFLRSDIEIGKEENRFLYRIEHLCIQRFNFFLEQVLGESIDEINECYPLQETLANIFSQMGIGSLSIESDRFFYLSLAEAFASSLRDCLQLLRECYADMIMIRTLDMKPDAFFKVLLAAFKKRDELDAYAHSDERKVPLGLNRDDMNGIDVMRILSALLIFSDNGNDPDALMENEGHLFRIAMSAIPEIIEQNSHYWEERESLRESMNLIQASEYEKSAQAIVLAWNVSASHLLYVNRLVKCKFHELQGQSQVSLMAVRALYDEICNNCNDNVGRKLTFRQLAKFLDDRMFCS